MLSPKTTLLLLLLALAGNAVSPLGAASPEAESLAASGRTFWSQGKRAEAVAAFKQSLAADPAQPALSQWLALQEKSLAPAAAALSEADEEAQQELLGEAQAALDSRRLEEALQLFEQGVKANPKHGGFLRGLAESHYALEHFDQARSALDQALALDPQDPGLLNLKKEYFHEGLHASGGSPWGSLLRSAILPGWGQYHNGQKGKGLAIGALTVGLLAGTVYTYMATDQAIEEYRSLGPGKSASEYDAAFGRADGMALTNNVLGVCFYGAYAYNLFDAALSAPPVPVKPSPGAARGRVQVTLLAFQY